MRRSIIKKELFDQCTLLCFSIRKSWLWLLEFKISSKVVKVLKVIEKCLFFLFGLNLLLESLFKWNYSVALLELFAYQTRSGSFVREWNTHKKISFHNYSFFDRRNVIGFLIKFYYRVSETMVCEIPKNNLKRVW